MLDSKEKTRKSLLLGARLQQAMDEEGKNDTHIAEACEVTVQAVWQWRATGKIDKFYLPVLAHALHRDISWFLVDQLDPLTLTEVNEERGNYTVAESAIRSLRALLDSGELEEGDIATLAEFARRFKSK